MKYIDADLLLKEIEKRKNICNGVYERDSDTYYQGKAVAYQETLSLVDSLQQEQPEVECDELEKISEKYAEKMDISKGWFDGCEIDELIKESYKAGYNKAKEDKK